MTRNKSAEWKVGLFVALGLALLATTLLRFSKSSTFLDSTYDLYVETEDISGLKPQAQVLLSGVQVGNVVGAELTEDQRTVLIQLRLKSQYPIRKGSIAMIEQAGFLGDKFISIRPADFTPDAEILSDGDEIPGQVPLGFDQLMKSADSFMGQAQESLTRVNRILANVEDNLLSEENLNEIKTTLSNIRTISERLKDSSLTLDSTLQDSGPMIVDLSSKLNEVVADLEGLAQQASEILSENRESIRSSLENIELTSLSLQKTLETVDSGSGMVGALLKDQALELKLQTVFSNLTVLSSNLNEHGLLYKPKSGKKRFWEFWKSEAPTAEEKTP